MDDLAFDRIQRRLRRVIDRMPRKNPEPVEEDLDWAIQPPSVEPTYGDTDDDHGDFAPDETDSDEPRRAHFDTRD